MNIKYKVCLTLWAVSGCNPHKVAVNPLPSVEVEKKYTVDSKNPLIEKWWIAFGDDELNRLIDESLGGNFRLQASWSRFEQAKALVTQTKAGAWPEISASFTASRSKNRLNFGDAFDGGGGGLGPPESFTLSQFDASLAANYEVDIWKKAGSKAKGALLGALATRDDVESMAMTVAGSVAELWINRVAQLASKSVVDKQSELSKTLYELAKLRFSQGLGSAGEVYQQEEQWLSVQGQLPNIEANLHVLKNQIALLCGKSPTNFTLADRDSFPTLPELPGVGVPVDLLDRRPDVRAARKRVEAADYGVAAAVADRLPSLRLSASAGFQENKLPNIFDDFIWRIAGGLLAPLFDRGRRRAEVLRNKEVVLERLANYNEVLLGAIVEVENAWIQEKKQVETIANLSRQQKVSEASLREAKSKYQSGVSDVGYLSVLTALSKLQSSEVALVAAKRQRILYRIALYRALGGTWTLDLENPALEEK